MPLTRMVGIAFTNHATFCHEKTLLKPAPKASFTELFAVFYPLALQKTQLNFQRAKPFGTTLIFLSNVGTSKHCAQPAPVRLF